MIGPSDGPYGRLHVGPNYEMVGATAVSQLSDGHKSALTVSGKTPSVGVWALLREGSPWLRAFPFGWVPVSSLHPAVIGTGRVGIGWSVDPKRLTPRQAALLAGLLQERGVAEASEILAGFGEGHTVAVGPLFVQSVHDFSLHVAIAVVLGPGGAA
jgi:hypothetical protein